MSDTNRYIPEHRRHQHKGKNQFRGDELRRRREDQQVEIRKLKKEENLAKRRNLDIKVQEWDGASGDTSESDEDGGLLNRKVSACLRRILKWMQNYYFSDADCADFGRIPTDGRWCVFRYSRRSTYRYREIPKNPFEREEPTY